MLPLQGRPGVKADLELESAWSYCWIWFVVRPAGWERTGVQED